ncbi:component of SufBCD complex [Parasedimentitalea maritima]|uniref:Component of SufBCD complex n=1 Tax=Parasedimentitalea maritima TaxID=2578117 RepID=A0A5R8ZEN9_9RHOB|nr:component of SufBCD complex [Zongyanglinia marina]KAE9628493.1 component of SufBCD complex [Zongyanglinia marina]TLP64289.1 component of SufBCD complex [Zongyanglinia marina]
MDLVDTLVELIDLRSFSNLWFWIALAVMWSSASHWVLGVPIDMVYRAKRHGGQAEQDLEDVVRGNVNRLIYIMQVSGAWLLALVCFVLSGLLVLGFFYHVEFAQAAFLLAFPLSLVGVLTRATAGRIVRDGISGTELQQVLVRCRLYIQMIGTVSIFVTAMWGMYQNLQLGFLG